MSALRSVRATLRSTMRSQREDLEGESWCSGPGSKCGSGSVVSVWTDAWILVAGLGSGGPTWTAE
jgi:uncharacterized membrane protein